MFHGAEVMSASIRSVCWSGAHCSTWLEIVARLHPPHGRRSRCQSKLSVARKLAEAGRNRYRDRSLSMELGVCLHERMFWPEPDG